MPNDISSIISIMLVISVSNLLYPMHDFSDNIAIIIESFSNPIPRAVFLEYNAYLRNFSLNPNFFKTIGS